LASADSRNKGARSIGVDDSQRFDPSFAQSPVDLRLCCDVAPAEWAMQTAEQTDQERLLPATFPSRAIASSRYVAHGRPAATGPSE
jgi:hypothetical protein